MVAVIYLDDGVLAGNDEGYMSRVKRHLQCELRIKDLGLLKYFFGIKVGSLLTSSSQSIKIYHWFIENLQNMRLQSRLFAIGAYS